VRYYLLLLIAAIPCSAQVSVVLDPVIAGLDRPVQAVWAHDGTNTMYIAQQSGKILRSTDGHAAPVFLDLSSVVSCCTNGGLLSVVFHPNYVSNGRFYVLYVDRNGNTVVARYLRSATDATVADGASEQQLFVVEQPKDNIPNHHGGTLQFGFDGMLYISIGDGGAYVKVTNRAQETSHLLGKLLRIDVDHGTPYSIPLDNPFVGIPGVRAEIWAMGLRNPWRFSFDRATGDLMIGDVGQDSWEEVDIVSLQQSKAANFGWPVFEGTHCYPPGASCSPAGFTAPQIEYPHADGCSVSGGYRYRGRKWPQWDGLYFYGDWCSGRLWAATEARDGTWTTTEVSRTAAMIVSFGEDDEGELFVVDYRGTVSRMTGGRRRAASH
jgi:glucose/arabinose dehydrogenase